MRAAALALLLPPRPILLAVGACGVVGVAVGLAVRQRRRQAALAMAQLAQQLRAALEEIDTLHAADPAKDPATGMALELLYAEGMTKWLRRLVPDPSPALQIACRAQHLERWLHPRDAFPKTKEGYLQWRTAAKVAHGKRAAEILERNGLGDLTAAVEFIVQKKGLGVNEESQAMEDAACLVFLEDGASKFIAQLEEKGVDFIVNIFQKTWGKMSERGRALALTLDLPPDVTAVVTQALGAA
eukprot:EG_transcript_20149